MIFEVLLSGLFLMATCAMLVTLFLRAFYHKKFKKALLFKGLASLCFVTLGTINLLANSFSYVNLIIFIGLCWGIVGDEIIALCQIFPKYDTHHFLGGGACFIVGHVLYMIALLLLGSRINIIAVAIAFALIVILCVVYESRRKFLVGRMKNSLKLYIGVVTLVTSVGIGVFLARGTFGTALFALGGALFTVSDNILFAFKFGARPRYRQNVALHIAYYLAQFVIAWSIAFI